MKDFVISSNVEGLIFDCDGTIADTMPLHLEAYKKALGDDAEYLTEALFYEQAGVPATQFMQILKDQCGLDFDPAKVAHDKEKLYGEMLTAETVKAVKPVEEIARKYAGKLPMAVASGGTHENVLRTLKFAGMLDLFQAVVSADEVQNGKPAPDMFAEAARRLKVNPAHCVVFEDGIMGFRAAEAAGMEWVDVRPWYPNGQKELARAKAAGDESDGADAPRG